MPGSVSNIGGGKAASYPTQIQQREAALSKSTATQQLGMPPSQIGYQTIGGRTQTITPYYNPLEQPYSEKFAQRAQYYGREYSPKFSEKVQQLAEPDLQRPTSPFASKLYTPTRQEQLYTPANLPEQAAQKLFEGRGEDVPFLTGGIKQATVQNTTFYTSPFASTLGVRPKSWIEKTLNIDFSERDYYGNKLTKSSGTDRLSNLFRNTSLEAAKKSGPNYFIKNEDLIAPKDYGNNFTTFAMNFARPLAGPIGLASRGYAEGISQIPVTYKQFVKAESYGKGFKELLAKNIAFGLTPTGQSAALVTATAPLLLVPGGGYALGTLGFVGAGFEGYEFYKSPSLATGSGFAGATTLAILGASNEIIKGGQWAVGKAAESFTRFRYEPITSTRPPSTPRDVGPILQMEKTPIGYEYLGEPLFYGDISAGKALQTQRTTTALARTAPLTKQVLSTDEIIASLTPRREGRLISEEAKFGSRVLPGSGIFEYQTRLGPQRISIQRVSEGEVLFAGSDEASALRRSSTAVFLGREGPPAQLMNLMPDWNVKSRGLTTRGTFGLTGDGFSTLRPDFVLDTATLIETRRSNVGIDFLTRTRPSDVIDFSNLRTILTAGRMQQRGPVITTQFNIFEGASMPQPTGKLLSKGLPFSSRELPEVFINPIGQRAYRPGINLLEFEGSPITGKGTGVFQKIGESDFVKFEGFNFVADVEGGVSRPILDYPSSRRELFFGKTLIEQGVDVRSDLGFGRVPGKLQLTESRTPQYRYVLRRNFWELQPYKPKILADDFWASFRRQTTGKSFDISIEPASDFSGPFRTPIGKSYIEPPSQQKPSTPSSTGAVLDIYRPKSSELDLGKASQRFRSPDDLTPEEALRFVPDTDQVPTGEDILSFARRASQERVRSVREGVARRGERFRQLIEPARKVGLLFGVAQTTRAVQTPVVRVGQQYKPIQLPKVEQRQNLFVEQKPVIEQIQDVVTETPVPVVTNTFFDITIPPVIIPPFEPPTFRFPRLLPSGGGGQSGETKESKKFKKDVYAPSIIATGLKLTTKKKGFSTDLITPFGIRPIVL